MAQIAQVGGASQRLQRPVVASRVALRRNLLVGALAAEVAIALGVVGYMAWPRNPPNIVAGPATPDVNNDSAAFEPQVAEEQLRVRQAAQEKDDSAVFGQAPSAPQYLVPGR